ncbi:hypothetical protein X753_05635 [Mesorhizobium sp. LNJC399B00]|nr:hypothetical protein X753_05635 [Mesorhizobium sp. LNJC399B00]
MNIAAFPTASSFVLEAVLFQIRDPNNHAAFWVEWEIFKVEGEIEASYIIIERMRQDTEAAYFP